MDFQKPFLINQRFLMDPSRNHMQDLETHSETRVEERHVNLLVQLCRHEGVLLERNFLVQEIWKDYGGGDEALTQGISVLRKILVDDQKELIKTIPKKGYIFQGEISAPGTGSPLTGQPLAQKSARTWLYPSFLAMALLAVLLIFLRPAATLQKTKPRNRGDEKPGYLIVPKPVPHEDKNGKHTSPPPGGKDDAARSTSSK